MLSFGFEMLLLSVDAVSVERLQTVDAKGLLREYRVPGSSPSSCATSGNSCEQFCFRGLVVVL
jgi:hypothetical protein